MTLQTRRWLILAAALIIAGVLAFPLRETIYQAVVVPVAFIAWSLNLFYRSLPQAIWWWLIIFIVFLMFVFSLVPRTSFRRKVEPKASPQSGQVEAMAVSLKKAQSGIYFRWLVANRLGKLAYQILLQRESGRPRSVFAPLLGPDWKPTSELQTYLETGLHGSFADFPNVKRLFRAAPKTPLDVDVVEAIEFLESQLKDGHV
jgi:hypothetical protein